MEKANIGGIKLSAKLVQLHFVDQDSLRSSILPFSHILKINKINMPFLSTVFSGGKLLFTCCVLDEDIHRVKELIMSAQYVNQQVRYIEDVGTLSVYPHRSRFNVLGHSLCALASAGISLYGMSSSVSSLTFVLKYNMLNKAVNALKDYLDLPEEYVPAGQR